jgi:hypothetical protein
MSWLFVGNISGIGYWVLGLGCWVLGVGSWALRKNKKKGK